MSQGGPSFWIGTTPETDYPPLADDLSVDVAIVGAGITGITAAVLLKRAGKTVALVESKRIVHGATGYTTAKVTSGHGLGYTKIKNAFGEDGTRIYAEANQAGLERIARFVEEDGIDCDFERKDNYVYADDDEQARQVQQEVEVAHAAGLPASLVRETPLPFPVTAAVRLENQAQFHPRKYLLALAESIPGDGSHVFERSRVHSVKHGEPCEVVTDQGRVRARDVVVATHLPILDRGLFFAKTYPHLSYALCAPIDPSDAPDGMFINAGTPTRSMRTLSDGDRLLLNVGGSGHKIGAENDTPVQVRRAGGVPPRALAGRRRGRVPLVDPRLHAPRPGAVRRSGRPLDAPRLHGDGLQQVGNDERDRRVDDDRGLDSRPREPLARALRLEAASSAVGALEVRQGERQRRLPLLRRPGASAATHPPRTTFDPARARSSAGSGRRPSTGTTTGRCTSSHRSVGTSGASWTGTRPSGRGTARATARATRPTAGSSRARPQKT